MRVRTKDDNLGEFLDGDVRKVSMHAMDHNTVDAAMKRELADALVGDASLHRPGFRDGRRPTVDAVAAAHAAAGKAAKEAAYMDYQRDLITAYKCDAPSPESQLASAKQSASTWAAMNGKSDRFTNAARRACRLLIRAISSEKADRATQRLETQRLRRDGYQRRADWKEAYCAASRHLADHVR
jgi:hypothetical protein